MTVNCLPSGRGLCLTNPEDFDFINTLQRYAETCWILAQKELVDDLVFKFRFQLLCSTALILTFNFPRKSNMHSQFCVISYLTKNSYWEQLRVLFLIILFPSLWAVCFHKVRVWSGKGSWRISVVIVVQLLSHAHGLQLARFLCPPLSPGVCSNSCPLIWWCCLAILSSATRFSFCLQSVPASG